MARLFKWASPDPTPSGYVESGGGGGGGGALSISDDNPSNRPFNSMWEPGDGTHPTWVFADLTVRAAPGQSAVAWLEVWSPDFSINWTAGLVSLDRTAETGSGNAVVEEFVTALVPAGYKARLKNDASGGSSSANLVHEQTLS